MLETVVYAIISAIFLSILGYLKNRPETGEEFDPQELLVTIIFGAIIGIIVASQGLPPTNENLVQAFIDYAGLITVVQYIVKAVYRNAKKKPV